VTGGRRPEVKIPELLRLTHDHETAGHRCAQKMFDILKLKYHWFKMKYSIDTYVKRCKSCGMHKKPKSTRPVAPLYMTRVSSKFERISIDFAGPFTRTVRGNKHILLGIDHFTKFAFAVPMSNIDSENVARVLIERWIVYFGCPMEIHSDKGSNLVSELIRNVYRLLNIKQSNSLLTFLDKTAPLKS